MFLMGAANGPIAPCVVGYGSRAEQLAQLGSSRKPLLPWNLFGDRNGVRNSFLVQIKAILRKQSRETVPDTVSPTHQQQLSLFRARHLQGCASA